MGGTRDLRRRVCLVLGVLLVAALSTLPARAGPEDRLQANQERLEQIQNEIERSAGRQDELTTQISSLDAERAEVESTVDSLEGRLAALDSRIGELTGRLEATQARLAVVTKELQHVQRQLAVNEEIHTERAIATYKSGLTGDLDALLSAESFGDLMNRYQYYEAALDQDARIIARIDMLRLATADKQDEIEAAEAELADAKFQLQRDRAELDAARAEKASVLAQREAVIAEKNGFLASAKAREDRLQVARDRIEEDSSRIQALLQARATGVSIGGPLPQGGGQLAWPAAGGVTSPYGYRIHPIFGYSRLHTGVDIGAGYGAPVVASADGVVAYVGVMSGYGNVVVVDHGGGMATTYNHLSAFGVSDGQTVKRRQTIAAVGCTGWCTGPHLHFEVRINGSPVDPMPYLG